MENCAALVVILIILLLVPFQALKLFFNNLSLSAFCHFFFQIKSTNICQLEKLVLLNLHELDATATVLSAIKLFVPRNGWKERRIIVTFRLMG